MRIALLEDDPHLGPLISCWLEEAGHDCRLFASGRAFTTALARDSYDLLILDWLLPDTTGDKVLTWVREKFVWRVPVIFVTARDSEEDVVKGLELGADDYMTKPVRRRELRARVAAVARRGVGMDAAGGATLDMKPYEVDIARRVIRCAGEPIALTTREFELALFLFRNAGRPVSRAHILKSVWGQDPGLATRTVDTHVSRLRSKLHLGPARGWRLTGIYHYGYRLEKLRAGAAGS